MVFKEIDDKEKAQKIRELIKKNDGHCPCKLVKNDDTKCICKEFVEQKELGKCHCGLYEKTEV